MGRSIRSVALIIVAAALLQEGGERLLHVLLRDIPTTELSTSSLAESVSEIQSIVDERTARPVAEAARCRPACVDAAKALEAVCERHVLAEASMSRAVCYSRVDDDRAQCLEACHD